MMVIPKAATWGGGLLRDLKVVSYLASTTDSAFSASKTWGSALTKISYAFLL